MKKLFLKFVILLFPTLAFGQASTINWTNQHQIIDGFGASDAFAAIQGTVLTTGQQQFFFNSGSGQLGLSILRVPVPNNGNANTGTCTSVSTSCAGSSSYISDMQAILAQGGRIYATAFSPPAIYTTNGSVDCTAGGGSGTLSSSDYTAYANWITNYLKSLQTYDSITVYAISLQNEPDICQSYDSSVWSASLIDTFIKTYLGPAFSSASISTLVLMPETSNYGNVSGYGGTCALDGSCAPFVGGYNWHDYQASISGTTVSPNPAPSSWPTKKWWETEASCGSGFGPNFCQSGFNTNMTDALDWAAVIDQRMQDGANAWLYWLLIYYNGGATPDDESLMGNSASSFAVASRAYVLGQYSKFIRPGMYRIDATHIPQSGITVSAYQNASSNALAVVATNQNSSSASQTFIISNAPTFTSVTPTITSASQNLATQSPVSVSGNSFTYTLPADSVVTFVGTGSGGTTYTLSTSVVGSGTISGCAGTYASGASYSCTVTPSGGYTLSSVTGCGGSGTTTYTGTMPSSNCTVTATFTSGSQLWSGLCANNRCPSSAWPNAGAGAIPARTTICQTLGVSGQIPTYAQSVTAANIVSALQACAGTNQTVFLNTGTYTMSTTLFGPGDGGATPSNVTLRGAGANKTILNWPSSASLNNCNGIGPTATCLYNGDSGALQYSANVLGVSSGMTQGSTSVVLGSAPSGFSGSISNLKVGALIGFNQLDLTSDNGNWFFCGSTLCSQQGSGNAWNSPSGTYRAQMQMVTVTGISGSTVTFTPAIYAPQWSSGLTPYATFSTSLPLTGFGLEQMELNTQQLGDIQAQVEFLWATDSWVDDVAFVNNVAQSGAARKHVEGFSDAHLTVQNSYAYGSSPSSEAYGVDLGWGTCDSLVQNNIFQHMATGTITEDACANVFGYNFAVDNFYTGNGSAPNWQQGDCYGHNDGDYYNLWEGHEGIMCVQDNIHGPHIAITLFRDYFSGFDPAVLCPGGGTSCGTGSAGPKSQDTFAVFDMAFARYMNVFLDVLGNGTYQNTYQNTALNSGCPSYPSTVIYGIGFYSGDQSPCSGADYPLTLNSLARWGTYDTVNGSVQTNSGETASGASTYPGLSSPSTSYSSYPSLYLSSKPSWLGSISYPVNGPDVTGGNISNVGGHANHNAAGTCFYGALGGVNTGASGVLNFDAYTVCAYGSGTPTAATPIPSPSPGPYIGTQTVSFTFPTTGSTGHCTTNGSTPTSGSPVYTGSFTVSTTTTLYCIAVVSGYTNSAVGGGTYTISSPSPVGAQGTVVFKGTIQVIQ